MGAKTVVLSAPVCAGVDGVESRDGPVVHALLWAGPTMLVIPSGQRTPLWRYRSAGSKEDRCDAYILADVVRTDRRRLHPQMRGSAAITAMRTEVRERRDLVAHRVAAVNHSRIHPQIGFPAAADMFPAIDYENGLRFIERFATVARADWQSPRRLGTWPGSHAYAGMSRVKALPPQLLAEIGDTYGQLPTADSLARWVHIIRRCWQDTLGYETTQQDTLRALLKWRKVVV